MSEQRWERDGITVVELRGTPEQIGEAHGRLLADEVRRACVELVHERVLPGLAHELFGNDERVIAGFADWCRDKARRFVEQIDDRYRAEIRALAHAADLDEEQLLLTQVLLDVLEQAGLVHSDRHFHACTQLALLPGRTAGKTLVGRNLDWPPFGMAHELGVLFHYLPADGLPFWALGWAGTVGTLTAVNHERLCVTEESLTETEDVSDQGVPTFLLHRDLVQQESTVQGAVDRLRSAARTNGYHTLIASGREADARVVEHSASESAVRPPRDDIAWGVDLDCRPALYKGGQMPPPGVPLTDETSDFRYGRLKALLSDHSGPIGPDDLQGWLDDRIDIATDRPDTGLHCLANETTLQSLVADLTACELHVAMGHIPAPAGGFVRFTLDETGAG